MDYEALVYFILLGLILIFFTRRVYRKNRGLWIEFNEAAEKLGLKSSRFKLWNTYLASFKVEGSFNNLQVQVVTKWISAGGASTMGDLSTFLSVWKSGEKPVEKKKSTTLIIKSTPRIRKRGHGLLSKLSKLSERNEDRVNIFKRLDVDDEEFNSHFTVLTNNRAEGGQILSYDRRKVFCENLNRWGKENLTLTSNSISIEVYAKRFNRDEIVEKVKSLTEFAQEIL
ncbi:MAG: hypothetical protein ABH851_09080 [Methanobacteriota archaeon]